jgi:hypothetical protein
VAICHSFLLLFFHIRYITGHGTEGSHHIVLYDEAGVCEWKCWYYTNHITYIDVMRLRQAEFWHGTGGLKVTVSSGNFGLSPQLGLEPVPHTSEALVERYLNGSQLILGN